MYNGPTNPWSKSNNPSLHQNQGSSYWASTEAAHVIYESRLELARLLYADFDGAVRRIVAQPFLLKTKVDQRIRKHVPDFLLVTEQGLVIVDVKPSARLSNPKIRFTLDWTRKLVGGRGWRYEVWCEPPAMELGNLRFLAGFRNPACFDATFLDEIRQRDLSGCTLGDALNADFGRPPALVRSAVFHLLWNQYLTVDVTKRLTRSSILTKGPRL